VRWPTGEAAGADGGSSVGISAAAAAAAAADAVGLDEGYVNLAGLQPGVRRERDESGYSPWLDYHRRRREQQP